MAIIALAELGSMWIGDIPLSPMRWDFTDEAGNMFPVGDYHNFTCRVLSPTGAVLGTQTGTTTGNHLELSFGAPSLATVHGIYEIIFTFTKTTGAVAHTEPFRFVVQIEDGWLTLEQAREQWADAPLDDIFLHQILDTAKAQCIAYAPAITGNPPISYVQAQLLQSRAIFQSVIANQNDTSGLDGFTVRVFPLDFTIRAMLRPKRAIGGMF